MRTVAASHRTRSSGASPDAAAPDRAAIRSPGGDNGARTLLTTDHKMIPDHTHPIMNAAGTRVLIQSGHLSGGKSLDLAVVDVPKSLLAR
jgi:hypothetical protein